MGHILHKGTWKNALNSLEGRTIEIINGWLIWLCLAIIRFALYIYKWSPLLSYVNIWWKHVLNAHKTHILVVGNFLFPKDLLLPLRPQEQHWKMSFHTVWKALVVIWIKYWNNFKFYPLQKLACVICYRQLQRLETKLSSNISMILSLLQHNKLPPSHHDPQQQYHPTSWSGSVETVQDENCTKDYTMLASQLCQNVAQQTLVDLEERKSLGNTCDKMLKKSQNQGSSSTVSIQVTLFVTIVTS